MTGWDVTTIDVDDEAELHAWWETAHAAQADRPYDFFPSWEATRISLPVRDPSREVVLMGVRDDGRLVGVSQLFFPMADNQHMAFCHFFVRHEARRRGIGSALVEAAEAQARGRGRAVLFTDSPTPPGEDGPGTHFAAARGFALANLEEHKVLDLAASEGQWEELEAESAGSRGDYRIEVWERIPDEHLEGICGLLNVFMSQIPLGDVALEALNWTPERIRESEERDARAGRVEWVSAAITPAGRLAGSSDVALRTVDPRIAHIGLTLVLPEHRGHRLGLGLKLATHRALRSAYPACELVATSNANVNEHMNAINARMGYRVVEQFHEFQKML